jgi:hypothetical protein
MARHDRGGACAAPLPAAVAAIVERFSTEPAVAAIALGGSRAAGQDDDHSDYDVYVFGDSDVPAAIRRDVALRFDPTPEIGNTWFGDEDAWMDPAAGIAIDLVSFGRGWFEHQLREVIERHQPALGYTTAFWHTARHAEPLFDRHGWLARMQELAASPYPEPLRRAIVAHNHPLLRTAHASYRHQLALAVERGDIVSVQHRTAALLASLFDILFATWRMLHPGEKRLLDHLGTLGKGTSRAFEPPIRDLLTACGDPTGRGVLPAVDALCDALDRLLITEGLLP